MATDSTFTTIGMVAESTFGTTPASALRLINVTDVQMASARSPSKPGVLSGSRRQYPNRLLQKSGTLSLPTRLQYENTTELWEALFANARSSAISISAATISFNTGTGTIADSGNGLATVLPGDLIYIGGADDAGNNGWKGPVLTSAAGALTVPAGQITATHIAGATVTIKTRRLIDGTTLKSLSTEYNATQLTTNFRSMKGVVPTGVQLKWAQNAWADETWTCVGKVPAMGTATIGTGAATAAKTSGFMTGVDDFGTIYSGASATAMLVSSLDLSIQAKNNPAYGLGNIGPSTYSLGEYDMSLAMSIVNDDTAVAGFMTPMEAHTTMSFWWNVVDPSGNKMAFAAYACKPDEGDPKFGAPGTQDMIDAKFSVHDAAKDSTSSYTSLGFARQFGVFWVPGP